MELTVSGPYNFQTESVILQISDIQWKPNQTKPNQTLSRNSVLLIVNHVSYFKSQLTGINGLLYRKMRHHKTKQNTEVGTLFIFYKISSNETFPFKVLKLSDEIVQILKHTFCHEKWNNDLTSSNFHFFLVRKTTKLVKLKHIVPIYVQSITRMGEIKERENALLPTWGCGSGYAPDCKLFSWLFHVIILVQKDQMQKLTSFWFKKNSKMPRFTYM